MKQIRIPAFIFCLLVYIGLCILSSCKGGAFTSRKYTKGIFREHFSGWDSKKQAHKERAADAVAKDSILFANQADQHSTLRGVNKNSGSLFPEHPDPTHKKILKKKKAPVILHNKNTIGKVARANNLSPHEKKRPSDGIKTALFVFLALLGFIIGIFIYSVILSYTISGYFTISLLSGFAGILLIVICLALTIAYFAARNREEQPTLSPEEKKQQKEEKKNRKRDPEEQMKDTRKLVPLYIVGILLITMVLLTDVWIGLAFYPALILLIISLKRTLRFNRFLREKRNKIDGNTENQEESTKKLARYRLFHFLMFLCFVLGIVLCIFL